MHAPSFSSYHQLMRILSAFKQRAHIRCMMVYCVQDRALAAFDSQGGLSVVAGVLVGLLAEQLFNCTGHTCSFSGLNYTAGEWRL